MPTETHDNWHLVTRRRSRASGHMAAIYRDYGPEAETEGRWLTVCEEHNTHERHTTLGRARHHLPHVKWCDKCWPAWDIDKDTADELARYALEGAAGVEANEHEENSGLLE